MAKSLESGVVTECRQADELSQQWSNTSDFKQHRGQEHPLPYSPAEHLPGRQSPSPSPGRKHDNLSSSARSQAMSFQRKITVVRLDADQLREPSPSPQLQQEGPGSVKPQIKND